MFRLQMMITNRRRLIHFPQTSNQHSHQSQPHPHPHCHSHSPCSCLNPDLRKKIWMNKEAKIPTYLYWSQSWVGVLDEIKAISAFN